LSKGELFQYKWNEFTLFLEGKRRSEYNVSAYLLRDLMFETVVGNPYIKKQHKPRHPKQLFMFPEDIETRKNTLHQLDYKQIRKAFKM